MQCKCYVNSCKYYVNSCWCVKFCFLELSGMFFWIFSTCSWFNQIWRAVGTRVCVCININIYILQRLYIYIHLYRYMYICVCVCVYCGYGASLHWLVKANWKHLLPATHLATSHWQLETRRSGGIYTTEVDKCYKSETPPAKADC